MKLVRKEKELFIFHLDPKEKAVLLAVLNQYPLIPPAHQRLSKSDPRANEASQQLLDDALAEQRRDNKQRLQSWLADPKRFREIASGFRATLSATDIEWLLQVLNDVRIGSWILLGSPEEDPWGSALDEKTIVPAYTMRMAAYFEMLLIDAVDGGNHSDE